MTPVEPARFRVATFESHTIYNGSTVVQSSKPLDALANEFIAGNNVIPISVSAPHIVMTRQDADSRTVVSTMSMIYRLPNVYRISEEGVKNGESEEAESASAQST